MHFNTLQIVFSKANDRVAWPGVMIRNARDYLSQGGSPKITTGFLKNESDGAQLAKFHYKRAPPTSEAVGHLLLIYSAWKTRIFF